MTFLTLHCRNSEAFRCSVLQTGSVVYGSLSITSFESVINQSELCIQILDACLTHARKHHRDPCRLSFTQRACSQASFISDTIPCCFISRWGHCAHSDYRFRHFADLQSQISVVHKFPL
jgi:uncharacterized protein YfcZ (UPF0381/DUF406 family)